MCVEESFCKSGHIYGRSTMYHWEYSYTRKFTPHIVNNCITHNLESDHNNEVVSGAQVLMWGVIINLIVRVVFAKMYYIISYRISICNKAVIKYALVIIGT